MLGELRIALPGVQLLFAFLLTAPFNQRFTALSNPERWLYAADLLSTAISCLFLVAPSVYHRLHWRRDVDDKEEMLLVFNRLAICGGVFLAMSINGSLYLILDFLFGQRMAIASTVGTSALCLVLWYALPLTRRHVERISTFEKQEEKS